MPHSNDRTLVSCAGDKQIRVFDIEYSASYAGPGAAGGRSSGRPLQHLSEADTNARVYRSHSDRVKRIVTESSPHLFLSCSEDGEVRQWDLRQPSSAYPPPRNSHGWLDTTDDNDSGVPPPLISYKRHGLDINTISCSPSQPHYIALGGAHLHCFLHDRRMLGRDKSRELGQNGVSSRMASDSDDNIMSEATQCVRRFAPSGQTKMKRGSNGHVTALKISDANPNEMVASWSGDHIYGFDLVRSPDAREQEVMARESKPKKSNDRAKTTRDRKRKRTQEGSVMSREGGGRADTRPRRRDPAHELEHDENEEVALRVRYENGQSESIPLREAEQEHGALTEAAEASMSEADRKPYRIANTSVKIRKQMFSLDEARDPSDQDPTGHGRSFTSVLGFASSILEDMDEIIRTWGYPLDPDGLDVAYQTTLRRHRESARRFIQASGTIARLLGGKLQTAGGGSHPMLESFVQIQPVPNETQILDTSEQYRYDFIKAICTWLDSGAGAVVEAFSRPGNNPRFPVKEEASIEAIDDIIVPYLLSLASREPVMNVDASRFEVDENRKVFDSEKTAVFAFAKAVKMPFQDLSSAVVHSTSERPAAQDRKTALRFWGLKVARGLLLKAGEGVDHSYIDQAFGGRGLTSARVRREERSLRTPQEEIDPDEEDPQVEAVALEQDHSDADGDVEVHEEGPEDELINIDDMHELSREAYPLTTNPAEADPEEDFDLDEDMDEDDADDDDADSSEGEEYPSDFDADSDTESQPTHRLFRRHRPQRKVHPTLPTTPSHRTYRGHCNVKTVKDVNFYGLNDEYVVSGSDDGNLFIWDRATSELVNILHGDGEVVNVVQGHPYEPVLAVSGIDSTIKIFGSDKRAQRDARMGVGITPQDERNFSSLGFGMRRREARAARQRQRLHRADVEEGNEDEQAERDTPRSPSAGATSEPAVPAPAPAPTSSSIRQADYDTDDTSNPSRHPTPPNGLSSRRRLPDAYRITSSNDASRQSSGQGAFITRSMLAQLAARMGVGVGRGGFYRVGEGGAGEAGIEGDGEGRVVVEEDVEGGCAAQ